MPSGLRPPDVPHLVHAWGRVQSAIAAHGDLGVAKDLTVTQLRLMGHLMPHRRLSGRQLADALGITPSSVVPLVDRLEDRGFVLRVQGGSDRRKAARDSDRRQAAREDRRITWIELTNEGRQAFISVFLPGAARLVDATAAFTEEERQTLTALLWRIGDYFDAENGEEA